MFYIIYVLICVVLSTVKCIHLTGNLPISTTQRDDLLTNLCEDYELNLESTEYSCMETLTNRPERRTSLSPAEVLFKCINSLEVTVQVDSNHSQIILLVPDDDSEVFYTFMKRSERFSTLEIGYANSYTFWSAVFDDDGRLSLWRRGSNLPQQPVRKTGSVRIRPPEFKFKEGMENVFAVITFDVDEDTEPCFTVTNSCRKKTLNDYYHKYFVWTEDQPSLTPEPLLLDDECTLTVYGSNETKLIFHTPVCLPSKCPVPEIPQDIRTYSTQSDLGGWDILVNWSTPHHPPERYNVTLCAAGCHTNIIHGNLLSTKFTGVMEEGLLYEVFVEAQIGNRTADTFRRALFPVRKLEEFSVKALVGGAWLTALIVAALLTLLAVLWRKHVRQSIYYKELEDKLYKEYSSDTTEDAWEIRPERLRLHEVIGSGAFGVVRRASLAPNGTTVAVKMMKEYPSLEEMRSFLSEMELMKSVGCHAHVVSLLGTCAGRRPLLVQEYCRRGDLLSYLRCNYDVMVSKRNAKYYTEKEPLKCPDQSFDKLSSNLVVNNVYDLYGVCEQGLTFPDLLSFCRQIAMGMEFLALNRVVHRDLAARNVLVTADRTLKIADFGLSRDVYQDNHYKQKGNGKMPIKWMALESLTQRIYTSQSDVWSFGVVMWEVVTLGGSPYTEVSANRLTRLLRAGYRMPRPVNCTKQLYDLMLSCWHARPRERPTFTELHQRLDQMLNEACADNYLSLDLQGNMPSPPPSVYRYLKLIVTGKRGWSRSSYERPLQPSNTNHYTSRPAVRARPLYV